jgi:hypothetical protein
MYMVADECSACNQEGTLSEFADRRFPFFSARQKADSSFRCPSAFLGWGSKLCEARRYNMLIYHVRLGSPDSRGFRGMVHTRRLYIPNICFSACAIRPRLVPYQARYLTAFAYFTYLSLHPTPMLHFCKSFSPPDHLRSNYRTWSLCISQLNFSRSSTCKPAQMVAK